MSGSLLVSLAMETAICLEAEGGTFLHTIAGCAPQLLADCDLLRHFTVLLPVRLCQQAARGRSAGTVHQGEWIQSADQLC